MGFIHDHIAAAGHEVEYFCADDVPARWHNGVGQRVAFPLMVRARAVTAAHAGRPYDIVNVHEPSAAPVAAWKRGAGSPAVVVTSHGLQCRAWALAKEEGRLGRVGPALTTRLTYPVSALWPTAVALRAADHIFCLNHEDRDYLTREVGRSTESVTRIYPAADPVYARAADGRGYTRGEQILFAGTWRTNKGIEDLVPAFADLARRSPRLRLTIVGAGVPEETVRAAFPEEIQDRLACATPADEGSMAASFAAADLFLLPSLFEGTPLTLMQAMMSGLPIVTTATCGMKDVITNEVNGLLVAIRSPAAIVSAITRLAENADLRARLGRAAQADARRSYTWDRVAAPVQQVYERLSEGRLH